MSTNNETPPKISDEELEALLKPYAQRSGLFSLLILLLTLGLIGTVIITVFSNSGSLIAALIIFLALILFCFVLKSINKKKYDELFMKYKGAEIEEIVSGYIGPNLATEENGKAKNQKQLKADILSGGLYTDWNGCKIDSYRRGLWKSTEFEAFNTYLYKEVTDGEDSSHTEDIFLGIWLICDTGLLLDTPVIVRMNSLIGEKKDVSYWNASTGNMEFDECFAVHSKDTFVANSLLTGNRVEQLLALAKCADAKISLSYTGSKVHIALETKHCFLGMNGTNTEHVSNLMDNLKASMEYITKVLDCIA